MKTGILSIILAGSLALSACAGQGGDPWGTKQTFGTAGGAVLGGLAGSAIGGGKGRLWTTGAGALIGALAGSSIGQSLDRADQQYHQQAVDQAYAAPLNHPISWSNPQTGHSGTVVPVREGREVATGSLCREYKQTIVVNGKSETAYGKACQERNGSWTLRNDG